LNNLPRDLQKRDIQATQRVACAFYKLALGEEYMQSIRKRGCNSDIFFNQCKIFP